MLISSLKRHLYAIAILSIFLLLHLPYITHPPLDEHFWRQVDTAGVARNFQTESSNILYPRVDGREQYSGITGMELPLYNYSIYITNKLVGYHHWTGRVVTLIMSLAGLAWLYLFARRRYDELTGIVTLIAGSTSALYFYFAHNIQPDISMVALLIGAVYYAEVFRGTKQSKDLYLSIGLLSLASLIKIPAIMTIAPIIYILGWRTLLQRKYLLYCLVILVLPNLAWYLHSESLSNNYGLGHYYYGQIGVSETLHTLISLHFWERLFIGNILVKVSSVAGSFCIILGIIASHKKRDYVGVIWAIAGAAFLIAAANKSFVHNYYSLVLVPPLALLAGIGLVSFTSTRRRTALLLALYLMIALPQLYLVVRPLYVLSEPQLVHLEANIAPVIPSHDLVIAYGGPSPAVLYFANRKGWAATAEQLNITWIESQQVLGAKWLIAPSTSVEVLPYPPVLHKDGVNVYRLR